MDCRAQLSVKNTFLEVDYQVGGGPLAERAEQRRSPSTPSSWRPGQAWRSDRSTHAASRAPSPAHLWPDTDSDGERPPCRFAAPTHHSQELAPTPAQTAPEPQPASQLCVQAPVFNPSATLASVESLAAPKETPRERELRLLLEALQATLLALPQAVDVQVCRGRKSSISVHAIFATLQDAGPGCCPRPRQDSAAKSKGMFVLGYRTNPFKDDESWGVSCGFSATVSYLSPGLADDACWDT